MQSTAKLLHPNLSLNEKGHLCLGGQDTTVLAACYGTPLYLYDEDAIRARCRTYLAAMQSAFGTRSEVCYASKAASFRHMYRIMAEEGLNADAVSAGEIYTALSAGFPMEHLAFHSNNKTDEDIAYAMECGVGTFIADNEEELLAIERTAAQRGTVQRVLLRLTPGIDPHTYEAISTGKVDSKFGFAIDTGNADQATDLALSLPHVRLCGFHCHVGSHVFDAEVYLRSAEVMLRFIDATRRRRGYLADTLNLGGGFGARYTENDPTVDIAANIARLGDFLHRRAEELALPLPVIGLEPGRSIVAEAGVTLYTVGTVKKIPGYRTYVSVDGGMTDNLRHALYGAAYTVLPADNMGAARNMTCHLVGRCCESGDILAENVSLPAETARGSLIATLTTGAYHYSMASNYNRIPRPPVVMLRGGQSALAVRRETPEDIARLDD